MINLQGPMKRVFFASLLISIISLILPKFVFGQEAGKQVPIKVPPTSSTTNALLYLPWDYYITTKKYPLILFAHGVGEAGNGGADLNKLARQGLPGVITYNTGPYAIVNNDTIRFIVLSIQATSWSPSPTVLHNGYLDLVKRGFRIDPSRVYVTGLSAGGGVTLQYTTQRPNEVSAFVAMSPAATLDKSKINVFKNERIWFFHGTHDTRVSPSNSINAYNAINAAFPGHARYTPYDGDHCCWMNYYAPSYREDVNGKSMNIYEWLYQFQLGRAQPPDNQAPSALAGQDQTITLPANSVTLDGTGSNDPDGSISTYKWTKKSGPSSFTFSADGAAQTEVSDLEAGTYVFTLAVTDDKGVTGTADIKIDVIQKKGNINNPVADAGNDITTTMPLNKVTLDASATKDKNDPGGYFFYHWNKVSGPDQFTIQFPDKPITQIQNLVVGTYLFTVTVKINSNGKAAIDTVKVVVKPDPTLPGDVSYTANNKVAPYDGLFQYGTNTGSFKKWVDTGVAGAAARADVHSLRLPLPDYFVDHYDYDIRLDEFNYYTHNLGMKEITLFVGDPADSHVDMTVYPTNTKHSAVFAHLYDPIWDNGENGTPINDKNYFASYIYNLVQRYGKNVRFWEIVNEPDRSGFWDNANKSRADSWLNVPPQPGALLNLRAPIFSYIRMLRIAYEIIKKMDPEDYVAPGGLGYPAFLDALLRYTDNPDGGKKSSAYPLTGGAYFDVLSFHSYPAYNLSEWDNSIGGFRTFRYSDRAADAIIDLKNAFAKVLSDRGYNGIQYPKKPFILTETNIPRKTIQDYFGTPEAQRNFIIKALVKAQKNDIRQFYIYQIAESEDYSTATGAYGVMGLYNNLSNVPSGQEKLNSEGEAYKTTSMLLYGWKYDSVRTNQMNLPGTIGGAAFNKGSEYRYVLWAKTHIDLSEVANATYSFPPSFGLNKIYRYEWNYSVDPSASSEVNGNNIALTGSPSFFSEEKVVDQVNRSPVADAGKNETLILPSNSTTLNGSKSMDPDGTIVSYKWTKTAGPSTFAIDDPNVVQTNLTGLVSGTYTFTLVVTDDKGATSADNVVINVNSPSNRFPIANSGNNLTITLPQNDVILDGSSSSDPDGTISSYKWTKKSGPSTFVINNSDNAKANAAELGSGTYVFTLTVTDNNGASSSSDVTVTVNSIPNKAPVANAGKKQIITLPEDRVTLDGSLSSDDDGKIAKYKWVKKSGPSSFSIEHSDQVKTELSKLVEGTYVITLTVTDDGGASASADVTIIVEGIKNKLPIAKAGNDQTIILPINKVTLDGSLSNDEDGQITGYKWSKKSGPSAFTIENISAAKTPIINLTQGIYVFTLTVTDNEKVESTDDVIITVKPAVNQSPLADAGSDTTIVLPGSSLALDGSKSSDKDGTIKSYKWAQQGGPSVASFSDATSVRTMVNGLVSGVYDFILTVTDIDGAKTTDEIKVTVKKEDNKLPIVKLPGDTTITLPVDSLVLDGSASFDPDGKLESYKWTKISGPNSVKIQQADEVRTLVKDLTAGTYVFALSVEDNLGGTAQGQAIVTVTPRVNQTPVAKAGSDHSISLPINSVTLDGSTSTDPDGKIVSYNWSQDSGPSEALMSDKNAAETTASNLIKGEYIFTLTVVDDDKATATDKVVVSVSEEANAKPVADAGKDVTISLPVNDVLLDGSGSVDPDGSIVSYVWAQESGPSSYSFSNANSVQTTVSNLQQGKYIFLLTVTDEDGVKAVDSITVYVKADPGINKSPLAKAGNDVSVTLPTDSVILNGSASSDPDGSIAKYQWTKKSGPTDFDISDPNEVETVVSNLHSGTYVFMLTVTDDKGAKADDNVTIVVNDIVNLPPIANPGRIQEISVPQNSVILDGSASADPDGKIVGFKWVKKSGPSSVNIEDPSSSTTKVGELVPGIYSFTLTVTDDKGLSASKDVTITVSLALNTSPVSDAGNDQTIILPQSSTELDGSASLDQDGSISTYKWKQNEGPNASTIADVGSAITSVSGLIKGTYQFTLTISDNEGATSTSDVKVMVIEKGNQLPIAQAGEDQSITLPLDSVLLDGSGSSDPDGEIAAYQWAMKSGPGRGTIRSGDKAHTVVSGLISGVYVFTLTVTDDQGVVASDDVKITVNNKVNQIPVANAGINQVITLPNYVVTLDGSGSSDPDGFVKTFTWQQKSGPSSAKIIDSNAAKTLVSGLKEGTYVFTLTVEDNSGATSIDNVTIDVNPKDIVHNEPPVAIAGSGQSITLPVDSVVLDGSASSDPDGTLASYKWLQLQGPSTAIFRDSSSVKTVVSNLDKGVYSFILKVTDDKGASSSDTVTVVVSGLDSGMNKSPIASAGLNRTITLPLDKVTLDGTGSYDPDGSIVSYQWIKISGPESFSIKNAMGAMAEISNLTPGTYYISLTVADNKGLTAIDTVVIEVNVSNIVKNEPPTAVAGEDQSIDLPIDTAVLNGSGSSDADGDIVGYKWVKKSGPSEVIFVDPSKVRTSISGLEAGAYVFTLTVTDDQGVSSSADVAIVVNKAPNQLPVIVVDTLKNVFLPDESVVLDGSASYDPDGKISKYRWKEESGPSQARIVDTTSSKLDVSGLVNGVYVFEFTVVDNEGAHSSEKVTVGVYETPNESPVANAGLDQSISLPSDSISLDGSSSYDPDGTIASYQWESMTGPTQVRLFHKDSALCIISGLQAGTYDFKLTVTDNSGAIAVATVSVYVLPANDSSETKFKVYPNPAHSQVHIELNKEVTGLIEFRIVDVSGRIVKAYRYGVLPAHISKVLDVVDLANGIYFIQLIEDNQLREVKKLIKY